LKPVYPYKNYTLELAPWERQVSTKAGQFDEALLLDDPDMPFLGSLLFRLARRRTGQRLWDFTMAEMVQSFERHCKKLGFWPQIECLYQLRHGGASHDKFVRKREDMAIQRRGRWSVPSSLRRYEKHGRVQSILNQTTVSMRAFGRMVLENFPALYLKRQRMQPPVSKMIAAKSKVAKRRLNASSQSSQARPAQRRKLAELVIQL
jgi:hypothetical protein